MCCRLLETNGWRILKKEDGCNKKMRILKDNFPFQETSPCVATIGFFDGVHKGHQYLIRQVRDIARGMGLKSMVITFYEHPRKVLDESYKPCLLTSFEEKMALLEDTGVDFCLPMRFSVEISHMTSSEFMRCYLRDKLQVKVLVMGFNHHFGKDNVSFPECRSMGDSLGIQVVLAKEYGSDRSHVCSSLLRRLVRSGDVSQYKSLCGHGYCLTGKVVKGHQLGRKIGFPTANINILDLDKILPREGVYAVRMEVQGKEYMGMANLGRRPTVEDDGEPSLEVHIIDFQGDIYGCSARVEFVERVRSECHFGSLEELSKALRDDLDRVKMILGR